MKKYKIVKSRDLLYLHSPKVLAEWYSKNKIDSITFRRGTFEELIKLEKGISVEDLNYIGHFQYGTINVIRVHGVEFFDRTFGLVYYSDFIDTTKSSGNVT